VSPVARAAASARHLASAASARHMSGEGRAMFIQTETTPNPNSLKFLPGRDVSPGRPMEFASPDEAVASPLAEALFGVNGVERVYFGPDFIAVSRRDDATRDWDELKAPVLAAIMDHFVSGQPALAAEAGDGGNAGAGDRAASHNDDAYEGDAAQVVAEIKDLLDTRIRPAVAQDGGDILFDRFDADSGTVWLHLRGACSGCPSSSATLKAGVENMLRHYVPEVTRVEQTL
jgi:Fe-S cluster biogenesis protein NfuA